MRRSGSSWGERRLDGAWMERALFSMSPMFCSACACLACHPPQHHHHHHHQQPFPPLPISHSIHFLPLYLPQLLQPHPPPPLTHLCHIPGPSVCGWRQANRSTVCVCVCAGVRNVVPSQPLAPPGDRWGDWIMWLIGDDANQMSAFLHLDVKRDSWLRKPQEPRAATGIW